MYKKQLRLEDYLDDFISEKRANGLAESSLKAYELSINKFINFVGTEPVTKQLMFNYINSLTGIAGETKKHYVRDVRVFLYWLFDNSDLERFKINLPKCQQPVPKIPTTEDVLKITAIHRNSYADYRHSVMANLVVCTGVRLRSLINIKLSDIAPDYSYITIRETKNKHYITFTLPEQMSKIIKRYLNTYDLKEYLFETDDNRQLSENTVKSSFRDYCKKYGCATHGLHALRHYFATESIRNGMSVFSLKQLMMHSDISVTMRYVNLVNADVQNDLQRFNPMNSIAPRS